MGLRLGRALAVGGCAVLLACAPTPGGAHADAGPAEDVTPACDPVTLASDQSPTSMAADGTSLYWMSETSTDGGEWLTKLALPDGPVQQLGTGLHRPSQIAVDATGVYWVEELAPNPGPTDQIVVRKLPFDGGGPIDLGVTPGASPFALAIDGTNIYFDYGTEQQIMQVPLAGGTPTVLAERDRIMFPGAVLGSLAADETGVYWINGDKVMMLPRGEATPVTLASNQLGAWSIALHATGVYWSSKDPHGVVGYNHDSLMMVAREGGTPTALVSDQYAIEAIAVDDTAVYWATYWDTRGTVMKLPLGGGEPILLAVLPVGILLMVIDASNVYWGNSGRIMTCPK
jgi:hypothetical protein